MAKTKAVILVMTILGLFHACLCEKDCTLVIDKVYEVGERNIILNMSFSTQELRDCIPPEATLESLQVKEDDGNSNKSTILCQLLINRTNPASCMQSLRSRDCYCNPTADVFVIRLPVQHNSRWKILLQLSEPNGEQTTREGRVRVVIKEPSKLKASAAVAVVTSLLLFSLSVIAILAFALYTYRKQSKRTGRRGRCRIPRPRKPNFKFRNFRVPGMMSRGDEGRGHGVSIEVQQSSLSVVREEGECEAEYMDVADDVRSLPSSPPHPHNDAVDRETGYSYVYDVDGCHPGAPNCPHLEENLPGNDSYEEVMVAVEVPAVMFPLSDSRGQTGEAVENMYTSIEDIKERKYGGAKPVPKAFR